MSVLRDIGPRAGTPQNEQADPRQVENNAGGYVFQLDDWARLERFLILGVDAGTFYTKPRPLALANARVISRCLDEDPFRAVHTTVEISDSGRTPKNDPAIFVMAVAAAHPGARSHAFSHLHQVCRIGTHLFHFAAFVEAQRGWGRGLRGAVSRWYQREDLDDLAYQIVKYGQRDGWTHRDLLRLAHPAAPTSRHAFLYDFICKRPPAEAPRIVEGFLKMREAVSRKEAAALIHEYRLPWECVPSEMLTDAAVWSALLHSGALPLGAMVRNLGVLTDRGVIAPRSDGTDAVVSKLANVGLIRKARLHPVALLNALKVYQQGHGLKGKLTWTPVSQIIDALDGAFYSSFGTVEPAGKRTLLALDISGSMSAPIIDTAITARIGAGAMAMVTAAAETNPIITAFTHQGWGGRVTRQGWPSCITVADLSSRRRLDDNLRELERMGAGGTDCALPMLWAAENDVDVDTFIIYTDNETWAGYMHPHEALRRYRDKRGIDARLIVVGMTSTGFTIADPSDQGMLDVVGFDAAAPNVMSSFSAGRF